MFEVSYESKPACWNCSRSCFESKIQENIHKIWRRCCFKSVIFRLQNVRYKNVNVESSLNYQLEGKINQKRSKTGWTGGFWYMMLRNWKRAIKTSSKYSFFANNHYTDIFCIASSLINGIVNIYFEKNLGFYEINELTSPRQKKIRQKNLALNAICGAK